MPITQGATQCFNSATTTAAVPIVYDASNLSNYGNGTIAVYVVNPLVSNNANDNNDVTVLVSIAATDDFEIARPRDQVFFMMLNPPTVSTEINQTPPVLIGPVPTPVSLTAPISQLDIDTQSAIDELSTHKTKIQGSATHFTLGPKKPPSPDLMKIHFGESVTSFRSFLKRYQLHEVLEPTVPTTGTYRLSIVRQNWPFLGGRVLVPGPKSVALPQGNWEPSLFPTLQYITLGYAGWRGGLRYFVDTSFSGSITNNEPQVVGTVPSFLFTVNTLNFDLGTTFAGFFIEQTNRDLLDRSQQLYQDFAVCVTNEHIVILSSKLQYA
jgi:hypothetical protein